MGSIKSAKFDNTRILYYIAISSVLIASFTLRYKGITFGFPLIVHPDEPRLVGPAARIIDTWDFNPHTFLYPSLYIYMQSFVYFLVTVFNKANSFSDALFNVDITTVYYWGRMLTILLSTATIFLTYHVTSVLFNKKSGLLSALFVGFSNLHITQSYLITTDSPMTFWIMASLATSAIQYLKGPKTVLYVLNGIFVGFAAGTKYNAVFCVLPMLYLHFSQNSFSFSNFLDKKLWIGLFTVILAFVCTTPYMLTNFDSFIGFLKFQKNNYSKGWAGAESDIVSYGFYFKILIQKYGTIPIILSFFGIILSLIRERHKTLFLLSFPLMYFLFMGSYKVHFERNVVCLIPFLAIFSGTCLVDLSDRIGKSIPSKTFRYVLYLAISGIILAGLFPQVQTSMAHTNQITLPDTRWVSKLWIEENLPANASIGREYATPPLDPKLFRVKSLGMFGLMRNYLWNYDYVIASSGDYGRFFHEEKKYPVEVQRYNQIFTAHKLVKEFSPNKEMGGPVIKIFKIK